ncbi:transcription termination/antitermination protein NusG [Chrysiogenes arsenatis]|uniref:transcription termination/antitermination protein NusG n=1 Tax=Chrysiogenes arsenatis TaxID=309797 RepID=UPI000421A8A9|nr:transcription termination/antitermination NusG family protein [Chrysiogenes arsenatis]
MSQSWYVIRTKPLSEHIAQANLSSQGFECFFPQFYDRRKKRVRPLFTCYLFVKFDYWNDFRAVSYTRSVANIVRFRDMPASIDEKLIEELRRRTDKETSLIITFKKGEAVSIVDGPFAGHEAVFHEDTKDLERVVIFLTICERLVQTVIARSDLDKS